MPRRTRTRQHHRRQLVVVAQQPQRIGQDRGGFVQQRVGSILGGLLAGGVGDDVAFVGGQAVVERCQRERVQGETQFLAGFLTLLAARLVVIALGAALGLVERNRGLGGFLAVPVHVLLPPLELAVVGHPLVVQRLQLGQQR